MTLHPNYFEEALAAAGKPVDQQNIIAVAGLFSANMALNANRWLEVVGTEETREEWRSRFQPVEHPTEMVGRPDDMIDFLWAVSPRLHPGIRDLVEQMRSTIVSASQNFGPELPTDMWSDRT
jgi:hypothetical protein